MSTVTQIGIDIAKDVFQLHGVDAHGKVVLRERLPRAKLLPFLANVPTCLVGMEACMSAHYWARKLTELGHTVRLMHPKFVKPYITGQKNDANDAAGICEAVARPGMRFVGIKSVDQQSLIALLKVRQQLIAQRIALGNSIRGMLLEHGIAIPKGDHHLHAALADILEDGDNELTGLLRELIADHQSDMHAIQTRIDWCDKQVKEAASQDDRCKRLQAIEGIGPISAVALVAHAGDPGAFESGRQFAAWIGLVPRQYSSGYRIRSGRITKQGNVMLRTLLVHGARSAVRVANKKRDPRSLWINRLQSRSHGNVAAVALANKNARIAWAILNHNENYRVPEAEIAA